MKRLLPLILFLIALSWITGACSRPLPEPTVVQKRAAAKVRFDAELALCVADGGADYDIEMCFAQTFERWGKDAGAFR